ncbi:MAG: hypothetical protein A2X85_17330 [Geobacteraceae bacterium GWF2_54_21]|nr:MAG: hypothetical protein A2X85_17330 [Geobacteraceae bacterium GWF2_54_21]
MRKRIYNRINSANSIKYSLWKYIKLVPSSKSIPKIIFPDDCEEDNSKYRVIPHSVKHTVESLKNKYIKEGIKEGFTKMTGYIPGIKMTEERFRFDTTNDPHSALNIFVNCVNKGFYPPEEVLTFLSGRFEKYLKSDDTLDSALKINKREKNNYNNHYRNINIIVEIDTLRFHFGISTGDAISAVEQRYADTDTPLTGTIIKDAYYIKGKQRVEASLMELHRDIDCEQDFDENEKKEFLEEILIQYPIAEIERLKGKYPLMKPLLNSPIEKLESATPGRNPSI